MSTRKTPLTTILGQMRERASGRILVAADYELLGIISASHIARWLNHIGLME